MYGYWILLSLYGFVLMGMDKRRARRKARRIPERRLFFVAAVGGAAGTWCGMKLWRHKTKHHSFTVGIPYLVAVHIIVLLLVTGVWVWGAAA
ncbi:DUF1294 domain-containing protein [Paenibacillus paeoniae]|uniref:DUF1294 domain-containing protein n=2 Tax=Paenibacillus paeoniae TaxID=2292705 RepID=A0A371PNU2_9BACL|nr:DUF1294 domain-containing protein [Paenibacillus paeoniae]